VRLIIKQTLLFVLLALTSDLFSQSSYYIDSLIIVAGKVKEDTNKLLLLSIIAENGEDDVWPVFNNEMGKLAAKLQKSSNPKVKLCAKRHLAASLNNKGFFFTERGIPYKAVIYFNKSLAIQREINDLEGEAYSLSNLGTIYDSKGEIDKALEYYFAAVKIRENLDSKQSLAQSYNNIAVLYSNQNDLVNALKYHFQSLKIRKIINEPSGLGLVYNNIGTAYTHLVSTQFKGKDRVPDSLMNKSLEYFQKGLVSYTEANNKHGIGLTLFNLADHYMLQADCYYKKNSLQYDTLMETSKNLFLQCLDIFTKTSEKEWIANSTNGLANICWRQSKRKEAQKYGEAGLALSRELGFPNTIQNSADVLRRVYQENGEFEKALLMSDLFYSMRDSVVNENNHREALSKYFLYESEKQQMLTKINQEKMEFAFSAKTKQQAMIIYFVISGLVILAVFGAIMYNRFKLTQKQNKIIQQQKHIVEESRKEIVDSINYAKKIQYALLAPNDILKQYLRDFFIYFKPKDIVSGDFYWATEHKGKFYLAVCDCTGHGVPGAFMSLLNIGFLSEAIKEKNITMPNEIFNYVRSRLIESIGKDEQQDGMDGILICLDTNTKELFYCAANNEPILISNNQLIELPKDRMPVGKGEKINDFVLRTIDYKSGDMLYLYTDGYADQFGGLNGKKFKYKQLNDLLFNISAKPSSQQEIVLNDTIENWKGSLEQVDDVCIIGIKL
jgi:serine phosphatase RsbU (regulator of sigma subunit)